MVVVFPFTGKEPESSVICLKSRLLTPSAALTPCRPHLHTAPPYSAPKRNMVVWASVLLHMFSVLSLLIAEPSFLCFFLLEDHFPVGSFFVHCTLPSFTHAPTHPYTSASDKKRPSCLCLRRQHSLLHWVALSSRNPRTHCTGSFTESQTSLHWVAFLMESQNPLCCVTVFTECLWPGAPGQPRR